MLKGFFSITVGLAFWLFPTFANSQDHVFLTESECDAITIPHLKDKCVKATRAGASFSVDTETMAAYQSRGYTVFSPMASITHRPTGGDTTISISISGQDTTRTILVSPSRKPDDSVKELHSISSALSLIAGAAVISLGFSVVAFFVFLNEK